MKIKKINEFFDTKDGNITININSGENSEELKILVVREIQKALRNVGGNVKLFVDDKKVNSRGYS